MRMSPERSSGQSEPSPFGDPDVYAKFVQEQGERADAQKQADAEKGIVEREVIAQGKCSTISNLKMENGEIHHEIDSAYQDNAADFKDQHPDIKSDFYLNLSIGQLAVDLAGLDATNYACFNEGSEELRTALLKNYSRLRERLDNPNTAEDEKQLIISYFQLQNGEHLSFLQTQYDEAQTAKLTGERFIDELKQLREEVESKRKDLDEANESVDAFLKQIDFIRGDRSIDYQELHQAVSNLLRAIEDAAKANKDFKAANTTYANVLSKNQNRFDQAIVDDGAAYIKNNDEAYTKRNKELDNLNEQYLGVAKHLEELLYRFA